MANTPLDKKLVVFDWNGTLYNARATEIYSKGLRIAPLFEGVVEVLAQLSAHGCVLGIATAESRPILLRELQHHGITQCFSAIRTASDGLSKPDPQLLWELMAEVGASATQTVMVGDTILDLQLAVNAGVDSIAVTYGLQTQQELACYQPLAFVDNIQQLLSVLLKA